VKFIETGLIDLPKPRGRFNISVAAEAARRIELATQFVGVRSRSLAAQLRQLAKSILPDRGMPETVKIIMEKVHSWTHGQPSTRLRDSQQSRSFEYGR
jgi:hypothetical protein